MSTATHDHDSEREQRLNEAIAVYLRAVDAGQAGDLRYWLERYPEFASELAGFFADQDGLGLTTATDSRQDTPIPGPPLRPAQAVRDRIKPGTILGGQYRILDIKSGGMGRVYIAKHLASHPNTITRMVAIKTLPDYEEWCDIQHSRGMSADESLYSRLKVRFLREAETWVRLQPHLNVINAFYVFEFGAMPYLLLEYANRGTLRSWIDEGMMSVPLAINFAIQFCNGMLHAIRTAGLVHRDIKPTNILLSDSVGAHLILKISDLGLSKAFWPATEDDSQSPLGPCGASSFSVHAEGTRVYMAPEQFVDLAHANERSDLFSFGVVLYEMLTGQNPFARVDASEGARRAMRVPAAHTLNHSVPSRLSSIVADCLAYDPADRCQSFELLAEDLGLIFRSLPDLLRLPIPTESPDSPRRQVGASDKLMLQEVSLLSLGQYDKAAQVAQQGIAIDPDCSDHWVNRGVALAEIGKHEDARVCFLHATTLASPDPKIWSNLAWAELYLDDPQAALEAAMRALELDDGSADSWFARGTCERRLGRVQDAVRSLERAVNADPANWKAMSQLAVCLRDLKQHKRALQVLSQVTKLNPDDHRVWYEIAANCTSTGQLREALEAIDRELKLDGTSADGWVLRAAILWKSGQGVDTARACLQHALSIDPGNTKARNLLAVLAEEANALHHTERPTAIQEVVIYFEPLGAIHLMMQSGADVCIPLNEGIRAAIPAADQYLGVNGDLIRFCAGLNLNVEVIQEMSDAEWASFLGREAEGRRWKRWNGETTQGRWNLVVFHRR